MSMVTDVVGHEFMARLMRERMVSNTNELCAIYCDLMEGKNPEQALERLSDLIDDTDSFLLRMI